VRKTTNKPVGRRTIRVIGDDWILSVAPEEAASIRRMIWRAFSGTAQRCFLKHEWRVKGWPSNAAKLMDFAKRHGFAVSDGARWLADKLQQKEQLGQSGRAGAPPARTISEGRDRKGRLSYLIRFGSKDTEPDFAAIHARVKELPGAHYLFRKGQAWAVEAQYQAEVVAFAEEFKFTLPAALAAGAEQGGPNEASGI
jgi:hypothetical protein